MAGAVSKTFGMILTILGGLSLVLGLAAVGWGVTSLEEESQRMFPDRERGDAYLAVTMGGLVAAGSGYLLLLVGLPLLVWGFQRVRDPQTGEVSTRPGGALKAWGIAFLLLGAVALLAGLVAAAFGAGVADQETQRMFPDDDRMEAAAMLAAGGLAVAGFGLGLVLLGVPFAVAGASKAGRAAPPPSSAGSRAGPPPDPSAKTAAFIVLGAAVVALLLLVGFSGSLGGVLPNGSTDEDPQPVTEVFEDALQGGRTPVVGDVGAGTASRSHAMSPGMPQGYLEAALEWERTAGAGPLLVVLEAQGAEGTWHEIGRGQGEGPIAARSGLVSFTGDVRATVSFAEGGGGAVTYRLVLQATPG